MDLKPFLEKTNLTIIDSLLDNPNPLITNFSAQLVWGHGFNQFSVRNAKKFRMYLWNFVNGKPKPKYTFCDTSLVFSVSPPRSFLWHYIFSSTSSIRLLKCKQYLKTITNVFLCFLFFFSFFLIARWDLKMLGHINKVL